MIATARVPALVLSLAVLGACGRTASDAPAAPPPLTAAPPPPSPASAARPIASPITATDAAVAAPARPPEPVRAGYPVGTECAKPEALAKEKRSLPPRSAWKKVAAPRLRLEMRVPEGAFPTVTHGSDALTLTAREGAHDLGPSGKERKFTITIRRIGVSADTFVAGKGKFPGISAPMLELGFPKGTTASFAESPSEPVGSGTAVKTTIAGHPAYVWVVGVEGYNTDYALVDLGPNDALVIASDWNSSVMAGQPECWQRAVIGGVVESVVLDGAP